MEIARVTFPFLLNICHSLISTPGHIFWTKEKVLRNEDSRQQMSSQWGAWTKQMTQVRVQRSRRKPVLNMWFEKNCFNGNDLEKLLPLVTEEPILSHSDHGPTSSNDSFCSTDLPAHSQWAPKASPWPVREPAWSHCTSNALGPSEICAHLELLHKG